MIKSQARNILVSLALFTSISCGGSSGGSEDSSSSDLQAEQKAILAQISSKVIVPTYQELAEKSLAMKAAADAFVADPTQAKLDAVRAAWVATRIPWERSEAFLFGPVDSEGYDPSMDSWPLEHAKLENTISSNASSPVDVATVEPDLKGFHAIEFLLYGFNKSKTLDTISAAERTYLSQLVADHVRITGLLSSAWSEGDKPFVSLLSTAGDTGNDRYTSAQSGVQEVFEAMIGIAEEVGKTKIAGPFDSGDTESVESQYSFNSLTDFRDNVVSLRNIYFGTLDGTIASASLSQFVKTRDAALDASVQAKITKAMDSITAIPEPFRDHLKDADAADEITAAITALEDLRSTLDTQVRPVVLP